MITHDGIDQRHQDKVDKILSERPPMFGVLRDALKNVATKFYSEPKDDRLDQATAELVFVLTGGAERPAPATEKEFAQLCMAAIKLNGLDRKAA